MLLVFIVLILCSATRTDLCGASLALWTLRHSEIQIYKGFQSLIWTFLFVCFFCWLNLNTTVCFRAGNLFMFDTGSG